EQLGDDDVRDAIVDRGPQEHDPVLEQARKQIPAALAPVGLLDDRRDDISVISGHRFSGADSQATSAARENRQCLPNLRPGSFPASAISITVAASIWRNCAACSGSITAGGSGASYA